MKYPGSIRNICKDSSAIKNLILILASVCLVIFFCSLSIPVKDTENYPEQRKDTIPGTAEDTSPVYIVVDEMPEFPGGIDSLTSYLTNRIMYPREALVDRVEGTVFVSFVVNTNGSTGKIKVIRGIHKALDRVAIEAVRSMPHWKAGKIKDKPVRTQINLPIRFMLPPAE
jgi:periplasmic protein TonB